MNKEFVPYEPSLRLKALGFDEPCLASYFHAGKMLDVCEYITHGKYTVLAPTFSQAFRFFREKYEIYYTIEGSKKFGFQHFIYDEKGSYEIKSEEIFKNYEEAELACLIRLIEIVEKEQENDK